MRDLRVGTKIWSLDQKTLKRELVEVTAKRQIESEGVVVKIKYESGESISASGRHQVLVVRDGIPTWLQASARGRCG